MPGISSASRIENNASTALAARADILTASAVFLVTAALFGLLVNRENALSYSIGYNLYGAERLLEGQAPYLDFHTLYPPGTLFINAALFKLFGTTLLVALIGVMAFKVMTTLMIYLCGRQVMPRRWAIAAALFSLFWLRPNGPFKAVPMHYGALFLATALYLLLKYIRHRSMAYLFFAGAALGLLALFKHNIGAYVLFGSVIVVALEGQPRTPVKQVIKNYRQLLIVISGFAVPIIPVLFYMLMRGAAGAMAKTLLFGPGDFLLDRLAAVPSPLTAFALSVCVVAGCFAAWRLRSNRPMAASIWIVMIVSTSAFILAASQSRVDSVIFYGPVIVLAAGISTYIFGEAMDPSTRASVLAVFAMAAAAFMETFPRFAREQTVAAMPFVALLLVYLLYVFSPRAKDFAGGAVSSRLALAVLPVMFLLMGGRLFYNTFFDSGFKFRSNTAINVDRGRGVFFPQEEANKIDAVVDYIRQRVPDGGYFFPQSYAGSSFLFLANRKNISGAQFWGGVGVTDAERAETLRALDEQKVNLIITRLADIKAEKYAPLRDYIENNFLIGKQVGDVLILERHSSANLLE